MPSYKEVDGNRGSGRFMMGPHDANQHNETRIFAATTVLIPAGSLIGKITKGALGVTSAAAAENAGNGVLNAAATVDAGAPVGRYQARLEIAAANGGTFGVYSPVGEKLGEVVVGAAYDGPINFQINDGANDFAVGDTFNFDVAYAAGVGHYAPYDPAAVNGTAEPANVEIAWHDVPISTGTQKSVSLARGPVTVNGNLLTYVIAANAGQKAAVEAGLAAKNIIVRY